MLFVFLLLSSFACLLSSVYKDRKVLVLSLVDNQLSSLLSTLLRLEPTQAETKEKKEKQDKTKETLPLILPMKKKRVAVALDASSPFLRAGAPSAWCSQRPRQ
jgi:hypothetical protein